MGYTEDNSTEASTSYSWSPAVVGHGEEPACVTEAGRAMLAQIAEGAKEFERQPAVQRRIIAAQTHLLGGERCELLGMLRFPSVPTRLGVVDAPKVVSLPEPEKVMTPCKRLRAGIKRIESINWRIFKEVDAKNATDVVNNVRVIMYKLSAAFLALFILCAYNGEKQRDDAHMHSLFFFVAIGTFIGLFMTSFVNFLALFHNAAVGNVMKVRATAKVSMAILAAFFMFMSYTSDKTLTACEYVEGTQTKCDRSYLHAMNSCVVCFVNIVIFVFHSIPDFMQADIVVL
jgi:hypothetical protein